MKPIDVAIVDDHLLVSKAIEDMISANPNYKVCLNASNGEELLYQLDRAVSYPEVILMDVNMPYKNGIETTAELTEKYSDIKVIALTMDDDEKTIIKMLKAGAKGYLLKDMSPNILFEAIDTVYKKGFFYTDMVSQSLMKFKSEEATTQKLIDEFRDKEIEFMKLACSELTYKEIADKMFLSPKTIDGYRDSVFMKLGVKSRVGMVLFAMRNNICEA